MTVIDASVWVSYLIAQDVNHQVSQLWLDQYIANNRPMIAPTLMLVEVAGAIVRRTGQPDRAQEAIDQLTQLRTLRFIELTRLGSLTAARLAIQLQLRGGDVVYVAIAQRLRVPLISWDREQVTRARGVIEAHTPEITN